MPTNYHSPVTFLSPVTMPQAAVSNGGVTLQQVQDMVSSLTTSSSGASGSAPGIPSIASLRNTTPSPGVAVNVLGYASSLDGGEGYFKAATGAASGTYKDDGGTIIVPTGGDGSSAWLRAYSGRADVKWFGATGDGVTDDTAAVQAAVDTGLPLWFSRGTYLLPPASCPVFINSYVVDWEGIKGESIIAGQSFTNSLVDDLTYPTDTYPGPMSGSAFYWVAGTYYPKIKGLTLRNFKFCFAVLNTPNTPVFEDCYYINCNAFTFWYKDCQIPTFIFVTAAGSLTGPLLIAGSTASPSGSPYAGQGDYTFFIQNIIYEGNGAAFGGGHQNPAFDTWFQNSILRPTVSNAPGAAGTGTTLTGPYPYATTDLECQPSGFMFYVAGRVCPGVDLTATNLYMSMGGESGCAMFNTNVNMSINYYSVEYEGATFPYHFTIGASNGIIVNNTTTAGFPLIPLINYTGKDAGGLSNGTTAEPNDTNSIFFNVFPGLGNIQNTYLGTPLSSTVGIGRGKISGQQLSLSSFQPQFAGFGSVGTSNYAALSYELYSYGSITSQTGKVVSGIREWTLPVWDSATSTYANQIRLNPGGQPYNLSGTLELFVLDVATGETDYGMYFINSLAGYTTYSLAASASNGDTSITIALPAGGGLPTTYLDSNLLLFIGGVGVLTETSFSGTEAVLELTAPIGGLSASGAPSGTVVTPRPALTEIVPLKRTMVSLNSSQGVTILSNRFTDGASSFGPTDSAVSIKTIFTSVGEMPVQKYSSGAPTTPNWNTGATVYEASPHPGNPIGYVCTAGGVSPVWRSYGVIEPSLNSLTGTSAGSVEWAQYNGTEKRVILQALGYENTTTTAQAITFPEAFLNLPVITENSTGMALSITTSSITFPASMAAAATGLIKVEGF